MSKLIGKFAKFFFLSADSNPPHDKSTHITYISILTIILFLPFVFQMNPTKDTALSIFGKKLPSACLTKAITNADCPGCGLTRSFTKISRGEIHEAFKLNRISFLLYIFFALSLLYHIYGLTTLKKEFPTIIYRYQKLLSNSMILILLLNWILGLYTGSNGGLNIG